MDKERLNYLNISENNASEIYVGGYNPDGNGYYDLSYLLGYGFAWISNYIGQHSSRYGLAFK